MSYNPNYYEERIKEQERLKKEKVHNIVKIVTRSILGLLAVLIIINSFYINGTGTHAVIQTFGKVTYVDTTAGIGGLIPFVQTARKVSVDKRYKLEYGYRTLKEGKGDKAPEYEDNLDEAQVIVGANVNNSSVVNTNIMVEYCVKDARDYLFNVADVEQVMRLVLENTLRNVFPNSSLDEALTNKAEIDNEIKPILQKELDKIRAGVQILAVNTQNTELLEAVDAAYKKIEQANQDKNGKLEAAQKYRNTAIPQAEAEAKTLVEQAKSYKADKISAAESDVANFNALYDEYKKNPKIIKERSYLEAMYSLMQNNEWVIDLTETGDIFKMYKMDNVIKAE